MRKSTAEQRRGPHDDPARYQTDADILPAHLVQASGPPAERAQRLQRRLGRQDIGSDGRCEGEMLWHVRTGAGRDDDTQSLYA